MSKAKIFVLNIIQEIRYKITWPAYHRLQSASILVLVASFMFALFIGLMDLSINKVFVWFCSCLKQAS